MRRKPARKAGAVWVADRNRGEADAAEHAFCRVAGEPSASYIKRVVRRTPVRNNGNQRGRECGSSGATPKRDNRLTRTSRSASPRARSAIRTARSCSTPITSKCRQQWSQVASDVLAQKYFRKAGVPARLKKVEEETVPSWLWRSVADEAALKELPEKERFVGETSCQAGVRPARRHLDLLGLEGRLFRLRGRRAARSSTSTATCWRCRWWRRIRRNGSTPACTGPMASTARARAISTSTSRPASSCKSETAYEHPQPHACFIQSIADDLVNEGGIMDLWVREARLFKYGSGTGSNFSQAARRRREAVRRRQVVRPDELSQDRRPRRGRHQVGRHHAPRRQDGDPRRRPSRHRDSSSTGR